MLCELHLGERGVCYYQLKDVAKVWYTQLKGNMTEELGPIE